MEYGKFNWNMRKTFSFWRWLDTGTGCPKRPSSLQPLRHWKSRQTEQPALADLLWAVVGPGNLLRSFLPQPAPAECVITNIAVCHAQMILKLTAHILPCFSFFPVFRHPGWISNGLFEHLGMALTLPPADVGSFWMYSWCKHTHWSWKAGLNQ